MDKHIKLSTGLFIAGITGFIMSEGLTVHCSFKASKLLEEKGIVRSDYRKFNDYLSDAAKESWKCYIPAAIATITSISCLFASKRLDKKEIAALTAALSAAKLITNKYRNEIRAMGNDILEKVDKAVTELDENKQLEPVSYDEPGGSSDDIITIYDPELDYWFETSKLAFQMARYLINRDFSCGGNITFDLFYGYMGIMLPDNKLDFVRNIGGSIEMTDYIDDNTLWIDISLCKSEELSPEGKEYYILTYFGESKE